MSFNPRNLHFVSTLVTNIEEGLVLTVGLLSGIAIAGISEATIVMVGTIFVFTAGIAAASRYIIVVRHASDKINDHAATQAGIMLGLLYILAGIVPLLPYMLMEVSRAFTTSIVCSFAAAFIIGLWSGHKGAAVWKSAWHMAYVAGAGSIMGAIAHAVL
jgi:VIT1/CCC1 family predicted Fe2+/Mn2+ transporter